MLIGVSSYDEARNNRARYPALSGKAWVLDVHLVTLEDLEWNRFVARLSAVLARIAHRSPGSSILGTGTWPR